jgi:hypothetical protein
VFCGLPASPPSSASRALTQSRTPWRGRLRPSGSPGCRASRRPR